MVLCVRLYLSGRSKFFPRTFLRVKRFCRGHGFVAGPSKAYATQLGGLILDEHWLLGLSVQDVKRLSG